MKKLLLMLLGVLIALPAMAHDFPYEYEGQTLIYTVLDEEAKTVETKQGYYSSTAAPGNKVSGVLTIPTTVYDGETAYTVVAIGENGFPTCGITEINLSETVTTIGNYAFLCCI